MPIPTLKGVVSALLDIVDAIKSLSSLFAISTPISFRAYLSADTSHANGSTIAFDTVEFNKGSGYDNTTYKFTVPSGSAGIYLFNANVVVSSPSDQERYGCYFKKNGSLQLTPARYHVSGTGIIYANTSIILSLVEGDTIEIEFLGDNTKTLLSGGTSQFTTFTGSKIDAIKGDTGETGATGPAGPSGGTLSYEIKTSNYTMDNNSEAIDVDTTSGAITITLPPSPADNQEHIIKNTGISSNDVTVNRNGKTIDKGTSNLTLRDNESVKLQYTTDGWKIR